MFYIQSSVLDFKNATFVGNSASGHGGAIYADTDSKLSGSICTFANNTAGDSGGAVYQTGFFPDMPGKHFGGCGAVCAICCSYYRRAPAADRSAGSPLKRTDMQCPAWGSQKSSNI